jgi:crotonobetaine/carnitine-CoA ligase
MEIGPVPKVLGELIDERAERLGNKRFLRFKDQTFTYADMRRFSNRAANAYLKHGIVKNDKVSMMLPNCPEIIHLWFGTAKIGAVEVPINTSYKGEFLRHIIDQSDSKMLIIDREYLNRVLPIQDELKKLQKVVVVGGLDTEVVSKLRFTVMTYEEFMDAPEMPVDVKVYPWDPISIIYTSGTTGLSKGGLGPHNFFITVAEKTLGYRDHRKEDIYMTFMPLYHFNAQVLTVLVVLAGESEMILLDKFSATLFWDQIREFGVTQFNYLGAVLPILNKQPPKPSDFDNPARVAFGGGCPPAIIDEVEKRFGVRCLEAYGMTEIGIPIHMTVDDQRLGSCGKPMDIYEVKLLDDNDEEVPVGEIGEIVFRSKVPFVMMSEYYNMPEKTLEVYRNLWFHTGDLAKQDKDGYFYFVDRKKDALRRRGENISSFEVERAINTHPKILESAAVAVKSELAEDEVKICVVLKPGQSLAPEELIEYANERMPYFAVPRFVEFMEALPKTPTERVQKHLLKQAGITPNTWDREKAGIVVKR